MLQGALHIHSSYSDGEYTLPQLREVFAAAGCRFLCVTDHAEAFDAHRLENYRRDCAALSDEHFSMLAGLEYACADGMHVLAYGVTSLVGSTDPQDVIRSIAAHGGISVVAHPKDTLFPVIEAFEVLPDGIEVWNSKYDGRYAPRATTFRLVERLRARRPDLRAFYGQDLHWKRQYRGLLTILETDSADRMAVLSALAAGAYAGLKAGQILSSSGALSPADLARFARVNRLSQRMRRMVRGVKTCVDAFGIGVPTPIKAQLRRVF